MPRHHAVQGGLITGPTARIECFDHLRVTLRSPLTSSSTETPSLCRLSSKSKSSRATLSKPPRSLRVAASQYSEHGDDSKPDADEDKERELELLRALNLDPDEILEDESSSVPSNTIEEEHKVAEVMRALNLNPEIPSNSSEFLAKVSSPEYQMRRRLEQTLSSTAFDVVENNPWREPDKPVFVLANQKEQLFTMRTRRPRREVEHELDLLFNRSRKAAPPKAKGLSTSNTQGLGKSSYSREAVHGAYGSRTQRTPGSSSSRGTARPRGFRMHVEDIREGILVFEDEAEAAQYCRVLDDEGEEGTECMGVAQFQAKELFKVCEKSKALAVIFKKGSLPPSPEYLRHTLKARKASLEDSEF